MKFVLNISRRADAARNLSLSRNARMPKPRLNTKGLGSHAIVMHVFCPVSVILTYSHPSVHTVDFHSLKNDRVKETELYTATLKFIRFVCPLSIRLNA